MPNDTMDKIVRKRARSEDFDEISAYNVLTTLKTSSRDLRENTHLLDSSVAPVELKLANDWRLEKNGDFYIVHSASGISFIIRKLDDKSLGMRKARMNGGGYVKDFVKWPFNFGNVVYADIDVNERGCKVDIEPIRMRYKYSTNEFAGEFYRFMKMDERDDSDDDSEMAA